MLDAALAALAAAGGTAVVQAAGTDAWTGFRTGLARWFGRGDGQREHAELERLERTAAALAEASPEEFERARVGQAASWAGHMEIFLESLEGPDREAAASGLRALVQPAGAVAGPGGLAVSGDVRITAKDGSIAAGVIQGDARIGPPSQPAPSQG